MKSATRPVLAALRKQYATQSAAKLDQPYSFTKGKAEVSRLTNGVVLASMEDGFPVSHMAVIYNAGSRFEKPEDVGLTHCLRSMASQSTQKSTGFGVTKNLHQIGASLKVSATREHMMYSLECKRDFCEIGAEYMAQVATKPAFKTWEISDQNAWINTELATITKQPHVVVMEALHKVAYRGGLGNPLYMPSFKVGTHTPQALQGFVDQHYVPSNMAIVGLGMDHDALLHMAYQQFGYNKTDDATAYPIVDKAKYYGGESRIECNDELVHLVVMTEGVSTDNSSLYPLAVLQRILGTGPYIKHSSNDNAKLMQAGGKVAASPFHASSVHVSYSDSGLFGFYMITHAQDSAKVVKAVVDEFSAVSRGNFTEADVTRAKAQVKAAILMDVESKDNLLVDVASQALQAQKIISPSEAAKAVDDVTMEQVQNIGKTIMGRKPSMAAMGDLTYTPYLDELF